MRPGRRRCASQAGGLFARIAAGGCRYLGCRRVVEWPPERRQPISTLGDLVGLEEDMKTGLRVMCRLLGEGESGLVLGKPLLGNANSLGAGVRDEVPPAEHGGGHGSGATAAEEVCYQVSRVARRPYDPLQ